MSGLGRPVGDDLLAPRPAAGGRRWRPAWIVKDRYYFSHSMFPIADSELSIHDIAGHWSREIRPPATAEELRRHLVAAWWRGELVGKLSRLIVLRALFEAYSAQLAFLRGGEVEEPSCRELGDGGVEVDVAPRLRVPTSRPDDWTEAECADAFESLSQAWNMGLLPGPVTDTVSTVLYADRIPRAAFARWVVEKRYTMPSFWGDQPESRAQEANARQKAATPRRRGPAPGSGHLARLDSPLVERAIELMRGGTKSAWRACQEVEAEEESSGRKLPGSGAPGSRLKRLYGRVRRRLDGIQSNSEQ